MAIRQIKEVNRSEGRNVLSGSIVGGQPLLLDPAGTGKVLAYNDATGAANVYGLAIESNVFFPLQAASGLTAGQGYDYTNFNRGGKVSCYIDGGEFELFDDGRGLPYESADTWTINGSVYADASGKLTSSSTNTHKVGSVVDFDVATSPTRLRIKVTEC